MVESLMLIALGFLTATLFAIVAVQFVWRRAVTLTTEKMKGELNFDEMQRTSDRLADTEAALEDERREVADMTAHMRELSGRNADLESTLAAAGEETLTLRDEIANLHGHYEEARVEAERRAEELAALQRHAGTLQSNVTTLKQRIAELEAAAAGEIDRQADIEARLRSLGEKATRLAAEMNDVFGEVADATDLRAAIAPGAGAPLAATPATLSPYLAEGGDEELRELNAIKASLPNFSESVAIDVVADRHAGDEEAQEADGEDALPNERFLAERIKALEAGVASRH